MRALVQNTESISLHAVTGCKCSVNPVTSPNPAYDRSILVTVSFEAPSSFLTDIFTLFSGILRFS
jgi:hypothetical protein